MLDGVAGVRAAVLAEVRGDALEIEASRGVVVREEAVAIAVALHQLGAAGPALGLGAQPMIAARGAGGQLLAAFRQRSLLMVWCDPSSSSAAVEAAVGAWAAAAANTAPTAAELWALLRRAGARGRLSELASCWRAIEAGAAPDQGVRLAAGEGGPAVQALVESIGSVVAGDGIGGGRPLQALVASDLRSPSLRWLALHWTVRAALRAGDVATASQRSHEANALATTLDREAESFSRWTAAEVLALQGNPEESLALLQRARMDVEGLPDRGWLAQTWLSEARILATLGHDAASERAARNAGEADPDWPEPMLFLVHQAILHGDRLAAERLLEAIPATAGARERALVAALELGQLGLQDAADFLREHRSPPGAQAVRTLRRIAAAAPGFAPAREALAWMLLQLGRHDDAAALFHGLLEEPIGVEERASVLLGLGCAAAGREAPDKPPPRLRALVEAAQAQPAGPSGPARAGALSGPTPIPLPLAPGARPIFTGELDDFPLPDMLEFLRGARRTGLLVYSSPAGLGMLRLRRGFLCAAATPGMTRLGELLHREGGIDVVGLSFAKQHAPGGHEEQPVGQALVRAGLADPAAVRRALELQIAQAVKELLGWAEGQFAFNLEPEAELPPDGIEVAVDPQRLLMQIFAGADDPSREFELIGGDGQGSPA